MCHESYSCSWFASEIALTQARVSCIDHTEELLPAASFEHCESMKLSSDHHILDIVDYQRLSHDHTLIASQILCQ